MLRLLTNFDAMRGRRVVLAVLATGFLLPLSTAFAEGSRNSGLELIEVTKIWDAAEHNAFTDLIRFQGRWYCAFREGQKHVSADGKLRVLVSSDGKTWESAALIEHANGDLRDAKLSITPQGRLMLSGAVRTGKKLKYSKGSAFQTLVWFSDDGRIWTNAQAVGEPNMWIWSVTWHAGKCYGVGYDCIDGPRQTARLYLSSDGRRWETFVSNLFPSGGAPNEASLVFGKDQTCYCLLRRDKDDQAGQVGISKPPYEQWTWKDLGQRIGGPKMIQLPDGRLLAALRLHGPEEYTALCWIDAATGMLTESLRLPSAGDNSYPGIVLHDGGLLWISYYSEHEGKSSIYLAKLKIGNAAK